MDFIDFENVTINDYIEEVYTEESKLFNIISVIVFIIGICGNIFVCVVVTKRPAMHTSTNMLLVNLAIADIVCSTVVIAEPFYAVFGEYFMTSTSCRVATFLIWNSETFLSIAIVLTFFIYSFYEKMSCRNCLKIIICVWAFTSAFGAIVASRSDLTKISDFDRSYCLNNIETRFFIVNYSIIIIFSIIGPAACTILHKILKHKFLKDTSTHRMLLIMIGVNVLSWIPTVISHLIMIDYELMTKLLIFVQFYSWLLVFYKPILYITCDKDFNAEFRKLMPNCFNTTTNYGHELRSI